MQAHPRGPAKRAVFIGTRVQAIQARTDTRTLVLSTEPDQAAEDEARDEERWIDSDESDEGEADGPDAGSIAEPILPDGYKVTLNIKQHEEMLQQVKAEWLELAGDDYLFECDLHSLGGAQAWRGFSASLEKY